MTEEIKNNEDASQEERVSAEEKVSEVKQEGEEKRNETNNSDAVSSKLEKLSGDMLSLGEKLSTSFDSGTKELTGSMRASMDELSSNIKEMIIRLDAINETISILPETNDHIKSTQTNFADANASVAEKLDNLHGLLEKIPTDINSKMEEQTKAVGSIFDALTKNNQEILEKLDSFLSNLNDTAKRVTDIADFEKSMNDKREAEFKMVQAKIYNERGMVLFYRGIFASALKYFEKARDFDENSPEVLNNIGHTLIKLKEYQKAEETLKKAVDLFPDFSEAYNNLGLMYMENSNYELAAEKFRKAIDVYSDFSDAYFNLGNALFSLKKTDEAVKKWEKAVELNPFLEEAKEKLKIYKKGDINA
ncbi:MAG: tetratricopeptide repeat protein [bacterium]